MKIGILTYHKGINHGAFLQAYSLQKYITETYNYDVEIIDYENRELKNKEFSIFLKFKPFFSLNATKIRIWNILKIIKFKKSSHLLNLSKHSYKITKINTSKYDLVILGSDEIWNFKSQFYKHDSTFFSQNINAKRIISFAASFGSVKITDKISETNINLIKTIKDISVRDSNSKLIITKQIGLNSTLVLDPTFLVNIDTPLPKIKNYLLVYITNIVNSEKQRIKQISKDKNLNIISIGYSNPWCDQSIIPISPIEWIGYFKNASFIATNTFHGVAFSLKYNKPFYIVDEITKKNKVHSLLNQLKVKKDEGSIYNTIETEKSQLELKRQIELSKLFLRRNLE
ncbi:MAG: polysaccharide pyruvyl transferase family protein [Marinilabiliaceae bacterium]|nr:polysaccharide pyruvyl transferase family protein [Marinilabiliaceae bacterium]